MKYLSVLILTIQFQVGICQQMTMKPLEELINNEDPGWAIIEDWIKDATNSIEILEKDSARADSALYQTQVTTRSIMGAITYETGGILIDTGWIRILGSGSAKLNRSLPDWNKGKSFNEIGEVPKFLLIADDAIGGFFALNGGEFGQDDLGEIYYLSPDYLEWEPLGVGYSDFIWWAFTGDLDNFYKGLRWKNWGKEVGELDGNHVINFYPFLWTKYEDLEQLSRKPIPIEEMWSLQLDAKNQLMNK